MYSVSSLSGADESVTCTPEPTCLNTDPQEITEPNYKRHVLYTFFAVDVFGARDRIRLPDCVVTAIRFKYPNLREILI
jgi:hypothetical protein